MIKILYIYVLLIVLVVEIFDYFEIKIRFKKYVFRINVILLFVSEFFLNVIKIVVLERRKV